MPCLHNLAVLPTTRTFWQIITCLFVLLLFFLLVLLLLAETCAKPAAASRAYPGVRR
jgi:hypothetical protein